MENMKKLTANNAAEVFKNNAAFRGRIWEEALDDIYYQVDEVFSYFRHYNEGRGRFETLKNYEVDYCRAQVDADTNHLKEFLDDCIEVQQALVPFNDDLYKKITRAAARVEFYTDAACGYEDISDEKFNNLEKWLLDIVKETERAIALYAQDYYTQFDDEGLLLDYFLTFWLDDNGDARGDFWIDENGGVYENITTVKKYV